MNSRNSFYPSLTFCEQRCTGLVNSPLEGRNQISFEHTHTSTTKDWTEAHAWRVNTSKQIRYIPQIDVYVAVAQGAQGELNDERAVAYESRFASGSWETYDDFTTMFCNISILRRDLIRPEGVPVHYKRRDLIV